MTDADAIIMARFAPTSEGGRQNNIAGDVYKCVLYVDEDAFDCRISVPDGLITLGETYELPVRFLYAENALRKLSIGKSVSFWEGKIIGTGSVLHVTHD